jgi:hypothetical protein
MVSKRVVVEHPDGRRVSVAEDDFDRIEANPHNVESTVREDTGRVYVRPARPFDDHQSLKAEGFKIVGVIDSETGHEHGLEED